MAAGSLPADRLAAAGETRLDWTPPSTRSAAANPHWPTATIVPKTTSTTGKRDRLSVGTGKGDRGGVGPQRTRGDATARRGRAGSQGDGPPRLIDLAVQGDVVLINGGFGTRNMPVVDLECPELSWEIIAGLEVPGPLVEILADSELIRQWRICAANGSVLITCYNNEASISVRRQRPDDGCGS